MKLPRFMLRDLFWLVLVAAMGCAWWVDHRRHLPPRIRVGDLLSVLVEDPSRDTPWESRGSPPDPDDETPEQFTVHVTRIEKDGLLVLHGVRDVFYLDGKVDRRHLRGKVRPSDVPAGGVVHVRDLSDFRIETRELDN